MRPISVQEIEKIAAQGIDGEFVPYILFYNQVHEVEPHPDVTNNENIDFSDLEPTLYAEVIEQFQSQAQQIFDNNPEQDNDLGELIWIIPTDNGEELIVRAEKDDDGQINVTVTPQSTTPAPAPNDPDDDPDKDAEKKDLTPTNIDDFNEHKIKHFVEGSGGSNHKWESLVPEKNWEEIKKIVKEVMETGKTEAYKNGMSKVKEINGKTVQVSYYDFDGIRRIGSGWVK